MPNAANKAENNLNPIVGEFDNMVAAKNDPIAITLKNRVVHFFRFLKRRKKNWKVRMTPLMTMSKGKVGANFIA